MVLPEFISNYRFFQKKKNVHFVRQGRSHGPPPPMRFQNSPKSASPWHLKMQNSKIFACGARGLFTLNCNYTPF